MSKKLKVGGLGCNDILSEMESLQILGGGIGGNGGLHDGCTHIRCLYNVGCPNVGCGTNNNCTDNSCHFFTECGILPADLYGEC